jgi:hypothetical protein
MTRQTLEPKPVRDTIDQVFLSPRVLDKAAFEEFTGIIRQLIERAAEDTKSLQFAAMQAEAIHRRLAEAAPLIESRLTGAGEAIRSLDAKATEIRMSLNKVAECALRAETAQARIDQVAREREGQLESSLAAAVQSGKIALDSIKAGVEERGREIGESALRAIEAAADRLADLEARASAKLIAITEIAEKSVAATESRLNDIAARVANLAGAGLSGVSALCDRATAILGYDPSLPETTPRAGSLGDFVSRAELADEFQNRIGKRDATWAAPVESVDPTEPCIGAPIVSVPAAKRKSAPRAKAKRSIKPRRKARSRRAQSPKLRRGR